jgi:hypothetical protein
MQTEQWVADRAQLQHLLHAHPEWTHKELAAWVGRSLGWVKKWVKRLREAPEDDIRVLFGLPRGRRKPYPQIDPLVEERILAICESPPEHLQRVPGPKAILYYLARDAELLEHAVPLPRSTRTIPEGAATSWVYCATSSSASSAHGTTRPDECLAN